MTRASADPPTRADRHGRLLFVVSADFGELGIAAHVLRGQAALQREAVVLLPPRLAEHNPGVFGCTTEAYASKDDVLAAIRRHEPDVVFLFSGYLFGVNGLMSVEGLDEVVRSARERGVPVVTSDPFLGLLSAPFPAVMDKHDSFRSVFGVLGTTHHFYPVPCDHLAATARVRTFSTHNPAMIVADPRRDAAGLVALERDVDPDGPAPYWLFVLAARDYEVQRAVFGRCAFVHALAARLRETRELGRRPVLLAPTDCLDGVRVRAPGIDPDDLLSFCGFDAFTRLLQEAEAVFYWNMISHSMLERFMNGLPVFFFDRGHQGRNRELFRASIDNFFVGWEPVCLDARQPLSHEILSVNRGVFRRELARLYAHYREAPDPETFVAQVRAAGA